jgi:hypothetical protein
MRNSDDDYPVGRGRPPRHSQYKKGQSGNPSGRPKGTPIRSTEEVIARALGRAVTVRTAEGIREVPVLEYILDNAANLAAKGDYRARRDLFRLARHQLYIGESTAPGRADYGALEAELEEAKRLIDALLAEKGARRQPPTD